MSPPLSSRGRNANVIYAHMYKSSAPRAADAARYARARKISTTKCVGGRKKRPMILSVTSDLIMARAACAELIALFLLCCMLAMSRSDRQRWYGCNLRRKNRREDRDGEQNQHRKINKTSTHTYQRYLVVLCVVLKKAQGSAPQGC